MLHFLSKFILIMEFVVERKEFLDALNIGASMAGKRKVLPILDNVKIKIDGTTFRREDIKSMYLLGQSEELKEDRSNILELAKKLTVPEFIEFCKDRGLSVKFLKEEKIYN